MNITPNASTSGVKSRNEKANGIMAAPRANNSNGAKNATPLAATAPKEANPDPIPIRPADIPAPTPGIAINAKKGIANVASKAAGANKAKAKTPFSFGKIF